MDVWDRLLTPNLKDLSSNKLIDFDKQLDLFGNYESNVNPNKPFWVTLEGRTDPLTLTYYSSLTDVIVKQNYLEIVERHSYVDTSIYGKNRDAVHKLCRVEYTVM